MAEPSNSLHDLRGMLRAAKKRVLRAHRETAARQLRESSPNRLHLTVQARHAARLHDALGEVAALQRQLDEAEFDRFLRNGFSSHRRQP